MICLLLKVCLNVVGKPDALSSWDGLLDLNEQETIRDDCRKQASEYYLQSELTQLFFFTMLETIAVICTVKSSGAISFTMCLNR